MTDLYETLGVKRDADDKAIRAAYRKRAKSAHPDGGGSTEDFGVLQRAMVVLLDPKARQRYDETGKVEEPAPDNEEAAALQFVLSQVDFVLAQIEARGLFLDSVDVVGDAKRGLGQKIDLLMGNIRLAKATIAALEKAAARFRAKCGQNRIAPMLRAKIAAFERNIVSNERDKRIVERAIAILDDHEFGSGGGKTSERAPNPYRISEDLVREEMRKSGLWR